ncbi:type VI secretion system-associated protein TagF [Ascidiaceihabitans sp.]|uniref:type VI secretion system-associated protein TagF n=1 Tax=Ascidiaceihabitans sp. TaxID=1872644 RepID=UPI0032995270
MTGHIFPHLGWFGKHPAFGDFVSHGMSGVVQSAFESWLVPSLGHIRQYVGGDWQPVYDAMQPIRFWIGPSVLDTPWPVRGVICPSRDKVGRRFPLTLVDQGGASQSPPVLDHDQTFYAVAEQMAGAALGIVPDSLGALIPAAGGHPAAAQDPEPAFYWAVNPKPDPTALLKAAGPVDHVRAVSHRSYWWSAGVPGVRATAFMGAAGMPGPDALAWMITGVGAPEPQPEPLAESAVQDTEQQETDLVTGDEDT